MPSYVKVGKIPPNRYTTFYKPDSKSLYEEGLFSTKGSKVYILINIIFICPCKSK